MPPLGWRKSVDGAKGKKSASQTNPTPVYNRPPPVPERTGIPIGALGGSSLGQGNTKQTRPEDDGQEPEEEPVAMEVDDPSTDSTPAPGTSTMLNGSSSENVSNVEMTPPVRSIKLKLKVKAKASSPPPERPTPRGRGRGGRGRGRGGRGRGGRARKIEVSPSESSGEESPVEVPPPLESEDDASDVGSEADGLADVSAAPVDEDLDEEDLDADADADADADIDPDATGEMDEDLNPDGDMDDQDDMDPEDEMNALSANSKSRLTARQAALVAGGSTMNHVMLPEATGRKAQRTEAEIALRRSETARKRKHQDAQRLEDEKTETINRLLKKQSAKARNKKALETPLNESAAPEDVAVTPDNRPGVPCYRWVSSAKDASPALSFSVPENSGDFPHNASALLLAASAQPVIRPTSTCAVTGCTAQRKYRLPGAPDFEKGACGMEHLKLLKTQAI